MVRVFTDAGYSAKLRVRLRRRPPDVPDRADRAVPGGRVRAGAAAPRPGPSSGCSRPRSVAVIGASTRPEARSATSCFANLLAYGFAGPVYPVHPEARHSRRRAGVPDRARRAGRRRPRGRRGPGGRCRRGRRAVRRTRASAALVVMSGGFAERDRPTPVSPAQRRGAGAELVAVARAHGMRVVGPNCLGVVEHRPDGAAQRDDRAAGAGPRPGRLLLPVRRPGRRASSRRRSAGARAVDLRLAPATGPTSAATTCCSTGRAIPATDVVLLYLESFGNPRKFARLARRVARTKPVVAVKTGRYAAATPALAARAVPVPEERVQALFESSGVIRVDTLTELFDVAQLLAYQPLPAGIAGRDGDELHRARRARRRRLCRGRARRRGDRGRRGRTPTCPRSWPACERRSTGPTPSSRSSHPPSRRPETTTRRRSRRSPPPHGCRCSPRSSAPRASRRRCVAPPTTGPARLCAAPCRRTRRRSGRCGRWPQRPGTPHGAGAPPARCPSWTASTRRRLARSSSAALRPPRRGRQLTGDESSRLLAAYGLPVVQQRVVTGPEEAAAAAEQLGYPVAVKATAPALRHRQDLGAVRLDLGDAAAVRSAVTALAGLTEAEAPVVVQRMAAPGVATVVEVLDDPTFGALVSFGIGGTGDRAARRPGLRTGADDRRGRGRAGRRSAGRAAAGRLPRLASRSTPLRCRTCCCGCPGWPRTCPRCSGSSSTRCWWHRTASPCSARP